MSSTRRHPWMLTAPWYRWADPSAPSTGRGTKPEIQQYAGFDYAREFLREPQRSLVPQESDYFHRTLLDKSRLEPNEHFTAEDIDNFELGDPGPNGYALPMGTYLRQATQTRKLYQPIHGYSYLIVTELHCDAPGLPSVSASEVEEVGFVVRRLVGSVDPEHGALVEAELGKLALIREQLRQLEKSPRAKAKSQGVAGKAVQALLDRPVDKKRAELLAEFTKHQLALDQLAASGAMDLTREAWIVDQNDPTRGRWQALGDATPERELDGEASFPMNPLFPDPTNADHSAKGRTIFSGTIPTGGREVEAATLAPRFDDRSLYEVRCFVRRKHETPGCRGELVWAPPSVGYRIASDADPEAGSRLPISISVPSFSDVKAFADRMATGAAGGVRIVMPPDSVMPLKGDLGDDLAADERSGIGQICFIAILLLFLIALFLMFAFLPIIVFIFQLFFLLRLKFCIPPSLSVSLEVAAKLKAEFEVDFELSAEFKAQFMADLGVGGTFEAWVDARLKEVYPPGELRDAILGAPPPIRVQRLLDLHTDFRASVEPDLRDALNLGEPPPESEATDSMTPPLPFASELVYYPRKQLPT